MSVWKVPVLSQSTEYLCWEACARMMWQWRFKQLKSYTKRAGDWAKLNKGLTQEEMNRFYKLLGLRSLEQPKGANLRHALKWSPVIFTSTDKVLGHAMVLAGFDGKEYILVNPCALETINFESEDSGSDSVTCQAKTNKGVPPASVENELGKYIWYW